jgi:hypothetical protein
MLIIWFPITYQDQPRRFIILHRPSVRRRRPWVTKKEIPRSFCQSVVVRFIFFGFMNLYFFFFFWRVVNQADVRFFVISLSVCKIRFIFFNGPGFPYKTPAGVIPPRPSVAYVSVVCPCVLWRCVNTSLGTRTSSAALFPEYLLGYDDTAGRLSFWDEDLLLLLCSMLLQNPWAVGVLRVVVSKNCRPL